jgi:aspartate racemase
LRKSISSISGGAEGGDHLHEPAKTANVLLLSNIFLSKMNAKTEKLESGAVGQTSESIHRTQHIVKMAQDESENKKILGVLGGMGPLASAFFMMRLTVLNRVTRDQDHVPTILWSNPRVPDRTAAKLHGGSSPLPLLLQGIKRLEDAGAGAIAIPCNTAHFWYDEMAKAATVPVLHIVEAVIASLRERGILKGPIGLMGTKATLKLCLYQDILEASGYKCIVPSDDEIDLYCTRSIQSVKANYPQEGYHLAAECVKLLEARGAVAVVLGCTELPLAIESGLKTEEIRPSLISSIDALVMAALHWYETYYQGN